MDAITAFQTAKALTDRRAHNRGDADWHFRYQCPTSGDWIFSPAFKTKYAAQYARAKWIIGLALEIFPGTYDEFCTLTHGSRFAKDLKKRPVITGRLKVALRSFETHHHPERDLRTSPRAAEKRWATRRARYGSTPKAKPPRPIAPKQQAFPPLHPTYPAALARAQTIVASRFPSLPHQSRSILARFLASAI